MLTSEVRLAVPGRPAPKGSLKCVGQRGRVRHQLLEDNARSKPWRDTITHAIRTAWPEGAHAGPHQPVAVMLTFTVDRPASHFGTGRNRRVLRDDAPAHPTTRSSHDVDKLIRLVLDALQDTPVLPDDAAVIYTTGQKAYAREDADDVDVLPWPGVVIRLIPLP